MSDPATTPPPTRKVHVDPARVAEEKRARLAAERAAAGLPPAAASAWSIPSVALLAVGLLLTLMGVLFLFTTQNIFIGILGGTLMASGMAWIAGFLVTRAVR